MVPDTSLLTLCVQTDAPVTRLDVVGNTHELGDWVLGEGVSLSQMPAKTKGDNPPWLSPPMPIRSGQLPLRFRCVVNAGRMSPTTRPLMWDAKEREITELPSSGVVHVRLNTKEDTASGWVTKAGMGAFQLRVGQPAGSEEPLVHWLPGEEPGRSTCVTLHEAVAHDPAVPEGKDYAKLRPDALGIDQLDHGIFNASVPDFEAHEAAAAKRSHGKHERATFIMNGQTLEALAFRIDIKGEDGELLARGHVSHHQLGELEGKLMIPVINKDLRVVGHFAASFLIVVACDHPTNTLEYVQRQRWAPDAQSGATYDIGHRGAGSSKKDRSTVRENTLLAFEKAAMNKMEFVEFDVHVTKEGEVVVHHDFQIKLHVGDQVVKVGIAGLDTEQLRSVDITRAMVGTSARNREAIDAVRERNRRTLKRTYSSADVTFRPLNHEQDWDSMLRSIRDEAAAGMSPGGSSPPVGGSPISGGSPPQGISPLAAAEWERELDSRLIAAMGKPDLPALRSPRSTATRVATALEPTIRNAQLPPFSAQLATGGQSPQPLGAGPAAARGGYTSEGSSGCSSDDGSHLPRGVVPSQRQPLRTAVGFGPSTEASSGCSSGTDEEHWQQVSHHRDAHGPVDPKSLLESESISVSKLPGGDYVATGPPAVPVLPAPGTGSSPKGGLSAALAGGADAVAAALADENPNNDMSLSTVHRIADRITTLREMLSRLPPALGFNVELKYPTAEERAALSTRLYSRNYFVDAVLKVLLEAAGDRKIILSTFDPDVAALASLKQPRWPVYFLTCAGTESYSDPRMNSLPAALAYARACGLQGVVAESSAVISPRPEAVVKAFHSAGLFIFTWGHLNNDVENYRKQRDAGVDGIILDDVARITAAMGKKRSAFTRAAADLPPHAPNMGLGRAVLARPPSSTVVDVIPSLSRGLQSLIDLGTSPIPLGSFNEHTLSCSAEEHTLACS